MQTAEQQVDNIIIVRFHMPRVSQIKQVVPRLDLTRDKINKASLHGFEINCFIFYAVCTTSNFGTIEPDWASVNLGVFLCINCAGIHRAMSVSRVRSVRLDSWSPEMIKVLT